MWAADEKLIINELGPNIEDLIFVKILLFNQWWTKFLNIILLL